MNFAKKFIYCNVIPFIGRLNTRKNRYLNVIYYHDIVDKGGDSFMRTPVELYKRQMEYIKEKGIKTYTFDELDNNKCSRRVNDGVLITFDDGWISNYTMIFEYMKSLGLKYNIFLAVNKIGKDPEYLTWEQINEMHNSGFVGFGAHTYTHCNMKSLENIDLGIEIHKANEEILSYTRIKVKDFCFPFGAYSEDSINRIIAENVYDRIYTSDLRYSYPKGPVLIFGRNGISCNEPFMVFKNKLNGYFNIFNSLTKSCRNHRI